MKIAMFGHKRIPSREGGVEIVVEELSTRLVALGHQVTCYNRAGRHISGAASGGQTGGVHKGVTCKTVWTIDRKGLAAVSSSFFAALRAAFSSAQVVHIHAEGPALMCWLLKLFGKKVVVTVHGLDWQRAKWKGGFGSKYIRMGEKMAVRFADELIVLSKSVRQYFLDTYGRETTFIPNGVSAAEKREAQLITQQFGLQKNGYILFLGRLVPEKGVHYLLEAFRKVDTDKKLVIAGCASDSDAYEAQLRAMAKADKRVVFTGFVEGSMLEELYSNAYVYVLPSDLEGMPLSLLEAMSYGNCCLVSDIAECTDVVKGYGVVFPKGDLSGLAQQLQRLCDDPETVSSFQATAGEYICREYNWDHVVRKTLDLYQKYLEEKEDG